jgi:hypothetical protein
VEPEKRTIVRAMLQHEDSLRDQRLGWLLTLNGFLFAALAFAWHDSAVLALVFGGVGIVVAWSTWATLRVSELAITRLRDGYPSDPDLAPVSAITSKDIRELDGWLDKRLPRYYTWKVIPIALLAAWVAVVAVRIYLSFK